MDYSDLLAKIQVLFRSLAFLEPSQNWSWHHPALVEWMNQNAIESYHALDEAQLWVVLQSLEKRHETALQQYHTVEWRKAHALSQANA